MTGRDDAVLATSAISCNRDNERDHGESDDETLHDARTLVSDSTTVVTP
jgi:hypothetical protein